MDYFMSLFIMVEVGDLDIYLGVTLDYFYMADVSNILENTIDQMTMMIIRTTGFDGRLFLNFVFLVYMFFSSEYCRYKCNEP